MDTLTDLLNNSVRRYGSNAALKLWSPEKVQSWSYAELGATSDGAADALQRMGVRKGDRVVIWAQNSPAWVAAFFGCLKIGAIVVPFDVRAREDFLDLVLKKTQARILLAGPEQAPLAGALDVTVVPLGDLAQPYRSSRTPLPKVEVLEDDIAEIVFTSGTTGAPKGVILTHKNLVSDLRGVIAVMPSTPDYRLLSLLPLSHVFEMSIGLLFPLSGGASVTYLDSLRPTTIFRAMQEERVTCMACVPQVLQLFMSSIEAEVVRGKKEGRWKVANRLATLLPVGQRRRLFSDLHKRMGGSFSFFVCGGAYLDPVIAEKWERTGIKVLQGYGLTEAAPVVSCDSLADREHKHVGRPIPGMQVRIAEDGEVLLRGANVTPGYWDDPNATAAAFDDGWYKTGDIGAMSAGGRIKLTGRKKNIIVLRNGMNVYPEDIEEVIKTDPRVGDCIVAGMENSSKEMNVHAIMVMKEADAAQDVVRKANGKLAAHQRVSGYTAWPGEDFPRTPTLKPKRKEILDALKMKVEVL
ncbi:MAG: long-chain fatty acid--CoA ligase [Dehalococcoidia bacterium]|nr:long-chain fatty acid--CoA ligase [Dehalococcoidia bacterium]